MATPILTPALTRLRSGFTVRYRNRSTTSDGWIGDLAHAQGTSGHNPDDTPGVSAERSDSDSVPEVRAIDVDVDLIPGDRAASRLATLQEIRRIIASPEDRRRLIYIIFDGLIWSASRDWEPATYTGSNQHREHAHYSGHPDYDNDGRAWSVETGEDEMAVGDDILRLLDEGTRGPGKANTSGGGVPVARIYREFHEVKGALAEQKLRDQAILAAIEGADGDAILARIDQYGAALSTQLSEVKATLAEQARLLAELDDGTLTQDEVISRLRIQVEAVQPSEEVPS